MMEPEQRGLAGGEAIMGDGETEQQQGLGLQELLMAAGARAGGCGPSERCREVPHQKSRVPAALASSSVIRQPCFKAQLCH